MRSSFALFAVLSTVFVGCNPSSARDDSAGPGRSGRLDATSGADGGLPVATDGAPWLDGAIPRDAGADGGDAGVDGGDAGADGGDAGALVPPYVLVGIPGGETGLEFQELPPDGLIPVRAGGQGGFHALVAIRCVGFGNLVYFSAGARDLATGKQVEIPELPRPRPISCDEEGVCKIAPLFVVLGGLAPLEEWEGLEVELWARIRNTAGDEEKGTVRGILTLN